MQVTKKQFETYVEEALDSVPKDVREHMYNVVIFVQEEPSAEQREKLRIRKDTLLFGLYEGYHQAQRLNVGAVLPDRVTIFRKAILSYCSSEEEIKKQISNTLKHEIAHHFGSDEDGARKAGRRNN